jgi:curved DNA-binding protein CbpA
LSASKPRFDASINYYQVLNVPFGASREEVTRAYRQLMRLTHPDQFRDPDERSKAEERAKLLNAAYAVLSKPDARLAYDAVAKHTILSDTLMQRYTGSSPGRPSPLQSTPRPPSARVVRAQRAAYSSAVRQLFTITAGFLLLMIVIALVLAALSNLL